MRDRAWWSHGSTPSRARGTGPGSQIRGLLFELPIEGGMPDVRLSLLLWRGSPRVDAVCVSITQVAGDARAITPRQLSAEILVGAGTLGVHAFLSHVTGHVLEGARVRGESHCRLLLAVLIDYLLNSAEVTVLRSNADASLTPSSSVTICQSSMSSVSSDLAMASSVRATRIGSAFPRT